MSWNVIMAAFRRSGNILVKASRSKIKSIGIPWGYSKTLEKSIGVFSSKSRNIPAVWIGPRTGKKSKYDAWFAHFIEFGVSGVGRFKGGRKRYRADMPARPFMRPSYDEVKERMTQSIADSFTVVLTKFIKKHAPKYYGDVT